MLLVAWAGGRIPDTRGLGEGRHRSRLRPSEALDPQGTPGALSRVRERVDHYSSWLVLHVREDKGGPAIATVANRPKAAVRKEVNAAAL